jgi:hypothetical protein
VEPPALPVCRPTVPIAAQPHNVLAARADSSFQEEAVWPVLSPTVQLVLDQPQTVQPA